MKGGGEKRSFHCRFLMGAAAAAAQFMIKRISGEEEV